MSVELSFRVALKFSLRPELVPPHIEGFIIQSDFAVSRFSALGLGLRPDRAEHSRAELELNLVLRGRADYLIGDRRVSIEARQMLWILPQQNRLVIDASLDFSAYVLVFRRRLVRRVCTAPASRPLHEEGGNAVLLARLPLADVQKLLNLYSGVPVTEGRDSFNAGLAYALARSWATYVRSNAKPASADVHPAVQRAAWLLCDSNEHLDNSELSARVGLSRERLSRLFKRQMGIALADFRNRQRIEHFVRAFEARPGASLLELALGVGFGSYPQFHRIFKQHMGCSPSWYAHHRKQLDPAKILQRIR